MKPIRSILLSAIFTIMVFSSVVYTACHKDKCNGVVCQNQGVCESGNCTCLAGYEDARCATLSRNKFIATFNGHDICNINDTNVATQYPVTFITMPSKDLEFQMMNFLNNPDDSGYCTIRSTDSFTFQGSNNGTFYSGYGTLRKDTLRMNYRVQIDTISYSCKYIGGSLW